MCAPGFSVSLFHLLESNSTTLLREASLKDRGYSLRREMSGMSGVVLYSNACFGCLNRDI